MSDRSPNTDVRLDQLQREVDRLTALADQAPEREAQIGHGRNPRLAKTCKDTAYPARSTGVNTYYIKFLDSTFTETEGDQTPTHTERQAAFAALAHLPDESPYRYLPEGSIVIVLWDNERWWIIDTFTQQATWIEFAVNDGSGFATTDSSVTVDGVTYHNGYTPSASVTTVYNKSADGGGVYIFEGDDNARGIALYDADEDKYYIVQMEC